MNFKELQQRHFSRRHIFIVDEEKLLKVVKVLAKFSVKERIKIYNAKSTGKKAKFIVSATILNRQWDAIYDRLKSSIEIVLS